MTEYKGWEDYVDRIRRNKQYSQIKEEWKGAVDEYFGVEKTEKNNWGVLKDLDKRVYHIKGHVDTLHERINNITDCGHGKLKQMVTPLHQANVIGRIEALEEWRNNPPTKLDSLENYIRAMDRNVVEAYAKIKKLEEWKQVVEKLDYGKFLEWQRTALAGGWKAVDKQVWEDIKTQIVTLSKFVYGISIEKLLDDIKKVDPEWEPDKK